MVMTKEEKAKYKKEYYEKNKEKILLQKKEYYEKNKEEITQYREKNKEQIAKTKKEYSQSDKGKMNNKISKWKCSELKCENRDEYEYIYDRWLNSSRCEEPKCNKEYTEDNWKCMDHCHLTGLFRNIICHSCNMKRLTKENTSGITNITKYRNGWIYQIRIKGQSHKKQSKDLEFLKQYKIDFENKYLYNI